MITEKEIKTKALEYVVHNNMNFFNTELSKEELNSNAYINCRKCYESGYKESLKDMDSEMCLFAEWAEQHYIKSVTVTGKWFDPSGIVAEYFTTSELLQIYKNKEK